MRTTRSTRSTRTRLAASAAVVALGLAGLTACGSDDADDTGGDTAAETGETPSADASPSEDASTEPSETARPTEDPETSEAPEPEGPIIDITVEGDELTPNAATLDLTLGEPLFLNIESDRAGELHVHATPEQYVDFEAGSTVTELVFETPGSVEIEEHDSGAVLALLTVR